MPITYKRNILILTSDTGGGHRSATRALENSFLAFSQSRTYNQIQKQINVFSVNVLEDGHIVTHNLVRFYNLLLRYKQPWMKYYYHLIEQLRPNESKLLFHLGDTYGKRLIARFSPDVIVSVHPMTQHFFAYLLRNLGLLEKIPLITVVTDPCYGFWHGWACPDVSRYYVASEEAKQQLVDYDILPEKIKVIGMPAHSKFMPVSFETKMRYRREWNLSSDKFTVFINSGWAGGGNSLRIFQALVAANLDIQVIFLAGHNERLRVKMLEVAKKASFPVHVIGFTSEVYQLMALSDVMVTKLGGLTTFEALACQLPIIADVITPPMPQESQTAGFIERTGTGVMLQQAEDIASLIQSLKDQPERCIAMRAAAARYGCPGAADKIAEDILNLDILQPDQLRTIQAVPSIRIKR